MTKSRHILEKLYKLSGILAACSIVVIMLLIVSQTLARQLGTHIPSSDDFSGILVVWATYFGLAYTMRHSGHIRVELITSKCSDFVRRLLFIISGSVACVLVFIFLYFSSLLVLESFQYGDMTEGEVAIPLWMVQIPMLIGSLLFLISVIDYTVCQYLNHKTLE